MTKKILVTGGAGYSGSHPSIALHHAGYKVVVYDNLSNSSRETINRISTFIGLPAPFIEGDIHNTERLRQGFAPHQLSGEIHFAGIKEISESVVKPLLYYNNNVSGSITLLEVMSEHNVKNYSTGMDSAFFGCHLIALT